jgi:Uma2 family endonuclease
MIEQTKAAAKGKHSVATFIIEIISDTDYAKNVEIKLWEYFAEGVQVVWHVMPANKLVKVYTSSPRQVAICLDNDICSAKPILADFEMSVNDIFRLEE